MDKFIRTNKYVNMPLILAREASDLLMKVADGQRVSERQTREVSDQIRTITESEDSKEIVLNLFDSNLRFYDPYNR